MDPKAVLFDLDLTLVDSSTLAEERKKRNWDAVRERLGEIRPYAPRVGPAPHELPGLLKRKGKAIAVVTSSPASYARAILAQFQIPYDVLVGYFDTVAQKPDPEPLNLALQKLGISPEECLYVGDEPSDAKAAYHAKIRSVGALWRFATLSDPGLKQFWHSAPEVAILQPGLLLRPEVLGQCHFVGEASADRKQAFRHEGYRLFWQEPDGLRVECLGRYFASEDERSGHAWSRRILDLKSDTTIGASFVEVISQFLNLYSWKPEYIVPVPPKPGEQSRFAGILDLLPSQLSTGCIAVEDGLACLKSVDGYKSLGHENRAAAIRGTLGTEYDWTGNRVLLLDDVLTSASTARECARVLKRAGASEVRVLSLGRAQEKFALMLCPRCGRSMRRRVRKVDRAPFWGCSGYPDHCRCTVPIES